MDGRSLHAWSVNLARSSSSTGAKPRLIELVRAPVPRVPPVEVRYVVRVGDAAVEVGDDFQNETLARVVRVLRAC